MSDEVRPENAMVAAGEPIVGEHAAMMMNSWGFGPGKAQYLTTIDEKDFDGRVKVFKLLQGNGESLDNYFNTEIAVTDFLISPIEMRKDNDGELIRLPLTRLLLADGTTILQTTGRVVAEVLLMYASKFRPGPWNPPAHFKPRKQTTRNGGQFYTLEPTFAELPAIEAAAKKAGKGKA